MPFRPIASGRGDPSVEQAQQQQALAQALYARSTQPNVPAAGGPVQAKYGAGNALVDLANTLTSAWSLNQANGRVKAAKQGESDALASAMAQYGKSVPDSQVGAASYAAMKASPEGELPEAVTGRSEAGQNLSRALGPDAQRGLAMAMMQQGMAPEEAYTLKPGETRFRGNRPVAALGPEGPKATDDQKEFELAKSQGFKGSFFDYMTQMKRAGAPNVSTTVNTEKGLYGGMASKVADQYTAQFEAATKAPDMLARATRVKALLQQSPLTGAGANWMLTGAKVAAQFGFNTGDAAADTEMLGRELSSSTLDMIKASGLGGGNGFSNADRDFLEKAVGGKITLEGKTLQRMADLNEKAALASMQKWNATAGRLDPAQLKTMGMGPIQMPAGTPPPAAQPKLNRNPDGSYTYQP
jgi:hypothetical protein